MSHLDFWSAGPGVSHLDLLTHVFKVAPVSHPIPLSLVLYLPGLPFQSLPFPSSLLGPQLDVWLEPSCTLTSSASTPGPVLLRVPDTLLLGVCPHCSAGVPRAS